ncbi:MAG: hypothetical protein P8P83_00220 [Rickettsiaceae bacterium]|nr:hypothetical protein [Rickettsiaceae bacterium]
MVEKIYNFVFVVFLLIKYLAIYIRLFFIKLRITLVKKNWYLSRNNNYYNPTFAATVYRYGLIWKIARYDNFFGEFQNKYDAMDSMFETWLSETEITATILSLNNSLTKTKDRIFFSNQKYSDLYQADEYPKGRNYRVIDNSEDNINFISQYFYLAQTTQSCYKCKNNILVNAIILPEGFETIDHDSTEDLEQQGVDIDGFSLFCSKNYLSILSYVDYISPCALEHIYKHIDKELFRKKYSFAANSEYYRSVCNYCNSAQGDNFVISEYNSAFHPVSIEDFKKIKFFKINEEIKISARSNSIGYGSFSSSLVSIRNIYK